MTPPTIQALGVTQEGSPSRWRATGYVEGIGWLGGSGHQPDHGHEGAAGPSRATGGRDRRGG
jgi:hypothetical protein